MKIAVLTGGSSAERDVAIASGREIARALRAKGHEVIAIDAAGGTLLDSSAAESGIGREPPDRDELAGLSERQLAAELERLPDFAGTDVVFVALHGGAGEDGRVQALLDLVGIPYTGSGPLGCALAMEKLVSKELLTGGGVPTPAWLAGPATPQQVESALGGFPVVVKPAHEGSTVGVSVVKRAAELEEALTRAAAFGGEPLIERFIPGRELAVGVLGGAALPIVEIRPQHEIYDYECKYTRGMSEYEVPAPLEPQVEEAARSLAEAAHRILRLSAYSRVDFRLDPDGGLWCLEANSLPGMTPTSLLPKAARAAGTSFERLCERIVELALERAPAGTPRGERG